MFYAKMMFNDNNTYCEIIKENYIDLVREIEHIKLDRSAAIIEIKRLNQPIKTDNNLLLTKVLNEDKLN